MHAQLDAVKQLLIGHQREHAEMQEKLRRTFTRSVVNLNVEVMDIFGEIPTPETLPAKMQRGRRRETRDGVNHFAVEPAPRVSVSRHH
jgi:hypothetical protein